MDINLIKSIPTRRNRGIGEARVAKGLDRSLLREEVVAKILVFRHWVGEGGDSEHLPILLEMKEPNKVQSPLLNSTHPSSRRNHITICLKLLGGWSQQIRIGEKIIGSWKI